MVLARYVAERSENDDTLSGKFHISSDLLEKATAVHDAAEWTKGITFTVYNYEKSNPALVTGKEIKYEIILSPGWTVDKVVDESSNIITPVDGKYELDGGDDMHHHTVTVKCTDPASVNNEVPLEVSLVTVSPYETELSADFNLIGSALPEYKVENNDTYVLLTVYSNLYDGNVTVKWTSAFSPNNGDPLMATWLDSNKNGYLTLNKNHTYELIFFKNTSDNYSKSLQMGTIIEVG
jgi:hypothetical protein